MAEPHQILKTIFQSQKVYEYKDADLSNTSRIVLDKSAEAPECGIFLLVIFDVDQSLAPGYSERFQMRCNSFGLNQPNAANRDGSIL